MMPKSGPSGSGGAAAPDRATVERARQEKSAGSEDNNAGGRHAPARHIPRLARPEGRGNERGGILASRRASGRSPGLPAGKPRPPLHRAATPFAVPGGLVRSLGLVRRAGARTAACGEPGLGRRLGVRNLRREGEPCGTGVGPRAAAEPDAPSPASLSSRRLARVAGRLASFFVLAVPVLLPALPIPAQAQTPVTLVSNVGQGSTGNSSDFLAQSFATGPDTAGFDGYTISRVGLMLTGPTTGRSTNVVIRKDDGAGAPSFAADGVVATLETPTLSANTLNTFTAPEGTRLDASTTYWLSVNEGTTDNRAVFLRVSGNGQASTFGWSVGDESLNRTSETGSWNTSNDSLRMEVKGARIPSTDATLSALAVNDGTNDLTLTPTFDPDTEAYTAVVAHDIEQVTVTGTKNESGARDPVYVDGDGVALTDADAAPGFQVGLNQGANVIGVKVTAADGTTAKTYTVTVALPATDVCERTRQVRNAIVAKVSGVSDCALLTAAHLAAIDGTLDLESKSIARLKAFDFGGLTALTRLDLSRNGVGIDGLAELPAGVFDDLTALTRLELHLNDLTELPPGIFDGLTALTNLLLNNNELTELPPGIFDGLTALRDMRLNDNELASLPPGVFGNLTRLRTLTLTMNDLTELPLGVFGNLTSLTTLTLSGNPGAPFRPTADAGADQSVATGATVSVSGAATGPWGENVTWRWVQVDGEGSDTEVTSGVALTGANSKTPSFTAPATAQTLYFRLSARRKPSSASGAADGFDWIKVLVGTVSTDTTLRSLALSDEVGNPVPLDPTFAAATTGYAAVVGNDVARITLVAKKGNEEADIAWLDGNDMALDDADGATDGFDVDLDRGANVIKMKVTAEDDATMQTYQVTVTRAATNVCERTPQVRDAIVAQVSGVSDCRLLTNADLLGISGTLDIARSGIASLKKGDFGGLGGVSTLSLYQNDLTELPEGVFNGLGNLLTLSLYGNGLTELPEGVFDPVTRLLALRLYGNGLESLRPGVFDGFTNLRELSLQNNRLASLPPGVFGNLTLLTTLSLAGNPGAPFTPTADAGADQSVATNGTVSLSGAATGPWGENVTWRWVQVDGEGSDTEVASGVALTGANSKSPSFTAPDMAATLYFRLRASQRPASATGAGGDSDWVKVEVGSSSDSMEAALRSLALSDDVGNPVPLNPVFAAATTGYTAAVGKDVARITLAAKKGHEEADIAWLDNNDTALEDADGATDDFQVDLEPGANVIKVKVTAGDGMAMRTYQVTVARPATDVCERTPQVRDVIVANVSGVSDCALLTPSDLKGLIILNIIDKDITSLKAGDFGGLSQLSWLSLDDNDLTGLPPGIFDELTELTHLVLWDNLLTELPPGIFDRLTSLETLGLDNNALEKLPPGLFDKLTSLTTLALDDNPGAPFKPASVSAGADRSGSRGSTQTLTV